MKIIKDLVFQRFSDLKPGDVFVDKSDGEGDICLRVAFAGAANAVVLETGNPFTMAPADPVALVEGEFVVKKVG